MSLAWGGLRTYLCFQYAVNRHVASSTAFGVYFILFVLPAVLQFGTFSLVTLYFSTVRGAGGSFLPFRFLMSPPSFFLSRCCTRRLARTPSECGR